MYQVGIEHADAGYGAAIGVTMALVVPAVVLFVIFQRYFVQSETSASLKE